MEEMLIVRRLCFLFELLRLIRGSDVSLLGLAQELVGFL